MRQIHDTPSLPKSATRYLFRSIFKLVFLSHYMFETPHQEPNLKHNICRGVLKWKRLIFFVASETRSFRMVRHLFNNFSRYSNSSSFVSHNYRLHFFYRGLNQKVFNWKNILLKLLSILVRALEYWQSEIPKIATYNVSSRHWKNSRTCYYFWFISAFKVIAVRNYGVHFFNQGRNQNFFAF